MDLNCFYDVFSGPSGTFSDGSKISIRDTDGKLQYWSERGFCSHAQSTANEPLSHLEIAEKISKSTKSGTQWVADKFQAATHD